MKTKSLLSWIQKSIYSALVFFGTLVVLSIGYAAYVSLGHSASGSTLSSATWNQLIDNVENLNSRMNSIPAASISGTISPSNLPFNKGQIVGDGSAQINDVTSNSTTSYYRVDGLSANKALIHPSVTWGDGNSQSGTMSIGGNVTGMNGSLSVSIPTGYYAGKTATVSDTNLIAGNIKSGVSVFGVNGNLVSGNPTWRNKITNDSACIQTCTPFSGGIQVDSQYPSYVCRMLYMWHYIIGNTNYWQSDPCLIPGGWYSPCYGDGTSYCQCLCMN